MPKKEPVVKKVTPKSAPVAAKNTEVKTSGLSVAVYGLDGMKKGTVALNKEIFGAKINKTLIAQAIRVYLVNQRQGTASTKTRGEVRGSTRKIYRQKGTGRARHGAITAPIFVGGGITFGPRPRIFDLKMSKQMRRKALFSALSEKMEKNQIFVVDTAVATGKTKEFASLLKALNLLDKKSKVLFVRGEKAEATRAIRNLSGIISEPTQSLNTYQVINSNALVFAKDAVESIEKIFLGTKEN